MQARLLTTLGNVYRKLALCDESLRLVGRGLALRKENLPATDPALGASLNVQGLPLEDRGRLPEAEAALRNAVAPLQTATLQDTTALVNALGNLGWMLGQHRKRTKRSPSSTARGPSTCGGSATPRRWKSIF